MKRYALACVLTLAAAAACGRGAAAETLSDALAKAYKTSPDLSDARASLRALDERIAQARSGYRPTVAITGSGGIGRSNGNNSTEQRLTPATGALEVVQPIYTGGETRAAIRQADSQILAGRAGLRNTEQQVLLSGVTVYSDMLRDQARLELNTNNEEVLRRQREATKDRFEVGEVTRTDTAQAEARLARASADRIQAAGVLAVSRATYVRVVGEAPADLQQPPPLPELPANLLAAVDVGLKENPVIEAAMHSERAGASAVDVAFADLLPRVDLQGRVSGSHETNLDDVSSESGTLLARVTIPLYQSGVEHSRVREAKERRNQFRIQVEQARRQVVEQVTQAWEVLTSTRSNIEARRQAVNANEIALDGVREEASVGSRTTLDVLDAEQELLDSRVALVDAERDEYVAGFTLLSALGRLSVERLGVPVEVYDPLPHYEKVRRAFWGWQTID
jgi:TolC family type I secretion outer membrane protein